MIQHSSQLPTVRKSIRVGMTLMDQLAPSMDRMKIMMRDLARIWTRSSNASFALTRFKMLSCVPSVPNSAVEAALRYHFQPLLISCRNGLLSKDSLVLTVEPT